MDFRQAMQIIRLRRGFLEVATFTEIYAEALHIGGATEDAAAALDGALAMMERNGELLWEANTHALMGELCLAKSDRRQAETEACFRPAMDAARRHNARMWELRAVPRLARLWRSQGKTTEVRDLLALVLGWLTEGVDTADLKDAKVLLDELG